MDHGESLFPLSLTFDDILLLPGYADFDRSSIDLSTNLTKKIKLKAPFVSAPMDTVTESKLAIKLGELGGIGIIHRNLSVKDQVNEVNKVLKKGLQVGAAVGAGYGFEERVRALVKTNTSVILVDSAHGYSTQVIDATKYIKKNYPKMEVISGNIATAEGAEALIEAGASGLRVGMGPGAICTTRIISGMGAPQVSAIMDVVKVAGKKNIPVIADGGIKYSGDMVKALALGAATCMIGSFFASTQESPGKKLKLTRDQVPDRFKSIFEKNKKYYTFKTYRGMGSVGAMKKGTRVKSEGEFHGKSYKDKVLVAEGVEGLVPIKGSVEDQVSQAVGGIKSGMYYVGAKNLGELARNSQFSRITQQSLIESHPHSVLVTNGGSNYH